MFRSSRRLAQLYTQIRPRAPIARISNLTLPTMSHLFEDATPAEVKNGKGISLITMSTPNGQKVQIMLEELAEIYKDIEWTTTLMYDTLPLPHLHALVSDDLTFLQETSPPTSKRRTGFSVSTRTAAFLS